METGAIIVILACCALHRTGLCFSILNTTDFIKQYMEMKIAVAPTTENRTPFEYANDKTRQGETPEVQPRGVALPP